MSVYFVFLCFWLGRRGTMNFLWVKLFLKMCKFSGCPCFCLCFVCLVEKTVWIKIQACEMIVTGVILCWKCFYLKDCFIELNVYWMCCKGFRWKVNLFVTEVSFENVTRVMGFTYVFDNGEKWKCLLMSMFFGAFCVFGRASSKNDFLRVKLVFKFVLKWKVFLCFWKWLKVQFVWMSVFFCVSSVLFKKLSGKNYAAFCFN
jgi:hypothetical protein